MSCMSSFVNGTNYWKHVKLNPYTPIDANVQQTTSASKSLISYMKAKKYMYFFFQSWK